MGRDNQLIQLTCSWLSLLLWGRRCLPRPVLKAWTQSGLKEAGAPWVPGEWDQTEPERVLSCNESPSSSLHSVLTLQQWLITFVPIAASWSALPQAGTEPGVLLPNIPAAQPGCPVPHSVPLALRPMGEQSHPEPSSAKYFWVSQQYHTVGIILSPPPACPQLCPCLDQFPDVSASTCSKPRGEHDAHPLAGMGHSSPFLYWGQ